MPHRRRSLFSAGGFGKGTRWKDSDRTGLRVKSPWVAKCGGYPPSPDAGEPDAGRWQGTPPGVFAFDALTQTPHNCDPKLTLRSELGDAGAGGEGGAGEDAAAGGTAGQ